MLVLFTNDTNGGQNRKTDIKSEGIYLVNKPLPAAGISEKIISVDN